MPHVSAIYTLYFAMFVLAFNGLYATIIPTDAITITYIRSVVAALAFVVFLMVQKKTLRLSHFRDYVGVYGLGIILGLHWVVLFQAFQVSTVAVGILSYYTYPVMTVFMEPFIAGGRVKVSDVFAGMIVIVGVITMVAKDLFYVGSDTPVVHMNSVSYLYGAFWGILAAVLMAFRNIAQREYFMKIPSTNLMFHQVVAISVLGFAFIDFQDVADFTVEVWGLFIILGVISTAGGHTLVVLSLKTLPAKTVAMISCAQPVVTIALAWIFLAEEPELFVAIGGSIILSVAVYESIRHSRQVAK